MWLVLNLTDPKFPKIVSDENGNPILFNFGCDAQIEANMCVDGLAVEF